MVINRSLFTSDNLNWETPKWLFTRLHNVLDFTVDAAAGEDNARLPHYWTKDKDALTQDWSKDRVFCNPPYGREISHWVKKAYDAALAGCECTALLIPARTDTTYWHQYVLPRENPILFLKGRIKFELEGKAFSTATFPSAVVFFLNSAKLTRSVYNGLADLGHIR